jgi:thymidylate synthase ThyX
MSLTAEERALIAPYVTSLDSPVFVLKNLPEEVIAVLFAYYSRSRGDLRTNLLRLLQDQELAVSPEAAEEPDEQELILARQKAKEFHEKWVVGYGHASVAEHAVAHVAIENVSIVASKVIEDARLAAYTEKSTRYVPFPRAYYPAPELGGQAGETYRGVIEGLFEIYEALLPQVTERVAATADRSAFKTDAGFRNSCQAQACDALRYLLPAATHTNIGMTANARTLEHLISKMLSHPLAEVRETGEAIRVHATRVIPTLIKYARENDYARETPPVMRALAEELLPQPQPGSVPVRLVDSPPDAEAKLAAAILYEYSGGSYPRVSDAVRALPPEQHRRVITEYLARRKRYGSEEHGYTDPPLRSLEHLYFTFEILVDYGAYRDIQRHRMATQTTQRLSCAEGYDVPDLLVEYGFERRFREAMERAAEAYNALAAEYPEEAQYVVPLAYRKRVLFTWNLRALHHFISLRSARQGHISYRRIACHVYDELARVEPFLAQFIRVDREEYKLARPG